MDFSSILNNYGHPQQPTRNPSSSSSSSSDNNGNLHKIKRKSSPLTNTSSISVVSSQSARNPKRTVKYVYDLPFFERKELCSILDENNQWEVLGGGLMCYSTSQLSEFGRAVYRNSSPTESLLNSWGSQNHTVLELFTLLARLQHFRAMKILKKFVDPKYHVYIKEPKINVTAELNELESRNSASVVLPGTFAPTGASPGSPGVDGGRSPEIKQLDQVQGAAVDALRKLNILNKDGEKNTDKKVHGFDALLAGVEVGSGVGFLPSIPYDELLAATDNWDRRNIIGKGGFGTVYRGLWKNTQVAIKRMEQRTNHAFAQSQLRQSLSELKFLHSYRHDNILPLYGFCLEVEHFPSLVYQYMTNGSLEDRLLCRHRTSALNWSLRFNIVRGVACGIQFLHSIGTKPLVHGDIKSANILLDKNFEAKLGDFGLAREMDSTGSAGASYVKVSRVHGTRPYLPDEYLRSKKLSIKVDTFSYGIMLYEVVTGQRAFEDSRPKKFLKDTFEESENLEILKDPKGGSDNPDLFWLLVRLGKACTVRIAKDRPDMVQVLKSLDGHLSQASIRTISSGVTGLPYLFETQSKAGGSLQPTGGAPSSNNPRLSPVDIMRTPSPHRVPAGSHGILPSVPVPSIHPSTTSSSSPGPPLSNSRTRQLFQGNQDKDKLHRPSPAFGTPPTTVQQGLNLQGALFNSDTNSARASSSSAPDGNGCGSFIVSPSTATSVPSRSTNSDPQDTKFSIKNALPRENTNIPITIQKASNTASAVMDNEDYFPLVLETREEAAEHLTVIPLITELGIKD